MAKLYSAEDCEKLTIEEVHELYGKHVSPALTQILDSFSSGDELVARAEGVWIETRSGRRILDVTGGTGVLNLGHNPDKVLAARIDFQREKRMEVHKSFFSPYLAALSHNLAQLLPGGLSHSYFCSSGAEAVEGAIKLAYKYHQGRRDLILHADISFHGKLLGAGSVTGDPGTDFRFPTVLKRASFRYGDLDSLKEQLRQARGPNGSSSVYAIIIEPFSVNHLVFLDERFLRGLRALCEAEDILLIFDEVHSGWCKTGPLFAFMDFGVCPDVLATSKALGGGKASISAYVTTERVLKEAYGRVNEATLHSTTYNGFGEECITALESINELGSGGYAERSHAIGRRARQLYGALERKHSSQLQEMRGRGAVHGIFLRSETGPLRELLASLPVPLLKDKSFVPKLLAASVVDRIFREHDIYCLFMNTRAPAIMFAPSLVIQDGEIERFFNALDEALSEGMWRLAYSFAKRKFSRFFQ